MYIVAGQAVHKLHVFADLRQKARTLRPLLCRGNIQLRPLEKSQVVDAIGSAQACRRSSGKGSGNTFHRFVHLTLFKLCSYYTKQTKITQEK